MPPTQNQIPQLGAQLTNLSLSGQSGNNSPLQFNSGQPQPPPGQFNQFPPSSQPPHMRPGMPPTGPPSNFSQGMLPQQPGQRLPGVNDQPQFNQPPFMPVGQQPGMQTRPGPPMGAMPPGPLPQGQQYNYQQPGQYDQFSQPMQAQ